MQDHDHQRRQKRSRNIMNDNKSAFLSIQCLNWRGVLPRQVGGRPCSFHALCNAKCAASHVYTHVYNIHILFEYSYNVSCTTFPSIMIAIIFPLLSFHIHIHSLTHLLAHFLPLQESNISPHRTMNCEALSYIHILYNIYKQYKEHNIVRLVATWRW